LYHKYGFVEIPLESGIYEHQNGKFCSDSFYVFFFSLKPHRFDLFYVILPLKQHNSNVHLTYTVYKAATHASRRKARGRKTQKRTFIGLPKETSHQERRICLTPDAVNSLTCHGHRVMIESGAGESSSYSDKEYSDAGAEVTKTPKNLGAQ
jgi:hypothetical protein